MSDRLSRLLREATGAGADPMDDWFVRIFKGGSFSPQTAGSASDLVLGRLVSEALATLQRLERAVENGTVSAGFARRQVGAIKNALTGKLSPKRLWVAESQRRVRPGRSVSLRESAGCTLASRSACSCKRCLS